MRSGPYARYKGRVKQETATHLQLELDAINRIVTVKKEDVLGRAGVPAPPTRGYGFNPSAGRGGYGFVPGGAVPRTPAHGGATPMHPSMGGSTPVHPSRVSGTAHRACFPAGFRLQVEYCPSQVAASS